MGRQDNDNLDNSKLIYPCMQASYIFEMNVVIQKIGLDQRKYYLSVRKYAWKIDIIFYLNFLLQKNYYKLLL